MSLRTTPQSTRNCTTVNMSLLQLTGSQVSAPVPVREARLSPVGLTKASHQLPRGPCTETEPSSEQRLQQRINCEARSLLITGSSAAEITFGAHLHTSQARPSPFFYGSMRNTGRAGIRGTSQPGPAASFSTGRYLQGRQNIQDSECLPLSGRTVRCRLHASLEHEQDRPTHQA